RRPGFDRILPRCQTRLCVVLAVSGADRAACRGAGCTGKDRGQPGLTLFEDITGARRGVEVRRCHGIGIQPNIFQLESEAGYTGATPPPFRGSLPLRDADLLRLRWPTRKRRARPPPTNES